MGWTLPYPAFGSFCGIKRVLFFPYLHLKGGGERWTFDSFISIVNASITFIFY